MIEIMPNEVVFGTPPTMVENIKLTLADCKNKGMIPTKELRSFVGRHSWVAGIIPRLRSAVTTIYAVLTAAMEEEATEVEFGTKESGRQEAKDWPGGSQETWHGTPLAPCDVPDTGPADQKGAFRRRKQCGVWSQTPHRKGWEALLSTSGRHLAPSGSFSIPFARAQGSGAGD